ncbi:peroxidase-related enzyme [Microbulbifer magnicolonia]|uniref:carboxymuconolactone decarboxylase family protein n=1 Tax=Microbulbifer magnicolonia TaxID=3109744 RepID=UPI002B409C55|nr:peroxidase-related enzyme [Microbulbifer sp. GG15]
MSRIPTPTTIDNAPAESRELLNAVNAKLGVVPNMFRLIGNSPAALEAYLSFGGALDNSSIDLATRERIALTVAQVNGCDYCLAAHSYIGANMAKLSAEEIDANRRGDSTDAKAAAAVSFARKVASNRGQVSEGDIAAVKSAGYSDGAVVEIIALVALNLLTNYINTALETEVDFPEAVALTA